MPLPIHKRYDVVIPSIPVMALEEQIAEKLARYRRASLARDIYSLVSTLQTLTAGEAPFFSADDESLSPLMFRPLSQPALAGPHRMSTVGDNGR